MNILEKEIEDIIWENRDNPSLAERGLFLPKLLFRQLNLFNYGIADIVGIELIIENFLKILEISVVEIKKGDVDVNTFLQAIRYCKGISRIIEHKLGMNIIYKFKIVLIGKDIDIHTDLCYITDIMDNVKIYKYSIDLDLGILFERISGYKMIREKMDGNTELSCLKDKNTLKSLFK